MPTTAIQIGVEGGSVSVSVSYTHLPRYRDIRTELFRDLRQRRFQDDVDQDDVGRDNEGLHDHADSVRDVVSHRRQGEGRECLSLIHI